MERRLKAPGKFWRVSVAGDVIDIVSGTSGAPGTRNRICCKSPEAALKTAEALVSQRQRDGFVEESGAEPESTPLLGALEPRLLTDDLEAWQVFADALMESGDPVRGECILLQLRAANRVRGAIGKAKEFLKAHYDDLVGSELGAFSRQTSIDWHFGYARTVKVWSGPHSAPIADVLEVIFNSPASRFLRRIELGSPGAEGRYGSTLRRLSQLSWPTHLDSLVMGAFDLAAAKRTDTTWPLVESLSALQPAPQLKELRLRAVLNTFGQKLRFPALEQLWLSPSRVDARLLADLATLEAPRLTRFALTEDAQRTALPVAVATSLEQLIQNGVRELGLHSVREVAEVLEAVSPLALAKLQVLDLRESLRVQDAERFGRLAPMLSHVKLELGDAPTLAKRLVSHFPSLQAQPVRPSLRARA